jgi:hypothetical protein
MKRLRAKWLCWRGWHLWMVPGPDDADQAVRCRDCGEAAQFKVNREPGAITYLPGMRFG